MGVPKPSSITLAMKREPTLLQKAMAVGLQPKRRRDDDSKREEMLELVLAYADRRSGSANRSPPIWP